MTTSQQGPDQTPIDIQITGDDTPDIGEYASDRVRELIEESRVPVLHARVRISRLGNPARERPVVAQANLDVNGRMVRAQFRAGTAKEAVDLLRDRLRRRLRDALQEPGDPAAVGTWRDAEEPQEVRHEEPSIPAGDREIARQKTVSLHRQEPADAAAFMDDMGYDFHLFTEATTDQDSVVYRSEANAYRLAQLDPQPDALPASPDAKVSVSDHGAPRLTVEEAVERIATWTQPFLFFRNADTDRGAVLYIRHDGHYGLISPSA